MFLRDQTECGVNKTDSTPSRGYTQCLHTRSPAQRQGDTVTKYMSILNLWDNFSRNPHMYLLSPYMHQSPKGGRGGPLLGNIRGEVSVKMEAVLL